MIANWLWSWIDCDCLNHNDSIHNFNFQLDSPKQLILSSFYLGFNSIRTVQQTNRRPAKDVAFMNRAIQGNWKWAKRKTVCLTHVADDKEELRIECENFNNELATNITSSKQTLNCITFLHLHLLLARYPLTSTSPNFHFKYFSSDSYSLSL